MCVCVSSLLQLTGVSRVRADQGQLGQQHLDGDPLKKPTGFMFNPVELLSALERRCFVKHGLCSRPLGGRHAECIGKTGQRAAIFQEEMCVAILKGIRAQLIKDRRTRPGARSIYEMMLDGDGEIEIFEE